MLSGAKWLVGAAVVAPMGLAALSSAPVAADLTAPPGPSTSASPTVSVSPSVSPSPTVSQSQTPTPTVSQTPTASPSTTPVDPGTSVSPTLAMESQLSALGLPTGDVDGRVTAATRRGICTFRDLTGSPATRKPAAPALMARIAATSTLPALPRRLRGVKALVSLTCQATYVSDGAGRVLRVLPVSTGKDNAMHRTRPGFKRVYYKVNRWQRSALFPEPDGRPGLYRPIYFDRGIAFHGVRRPVRTYPQSHACVRTWPGDQDWLWTHLQVRDRVFVYGDYWRGRSASLGGYGKPAG